METVSFGRRNKVVIFYHTMFQLLWLHCFAWLQLLLFMFSRYMLFLQFYYFLFFFVLLVLMCFLVRYSAIGFLTRVAKYVILHYFRVILLSRCSLFVIWGNFQTMFTLFIKSDNILSFIGILVAFPIKFQILKAIIKWY